MEPDRTQNRSREMFLCNIKNRRHVLAVVKLATVKV